MRLIFWHMVTETDEHEAIVGSTLMQNITGWWPQLHGSQDAAPIADCAMMSVVRLEIRHASMV